MTVTEAASTKKKDKSNLTTVKRMLSAYKKRNEEKIANSLTIVRTGLV